jgi:hypothetical protein
VDSENSALGIKNLMVLCKEVHRIISRLSHCVLVACRTALWCWSLHWQAQAGWQHCCCCCWNEEQHALHASNKRHGYIKCFCLLLCLQDGPVVLEPALAARLAAQAGSTTGAAGSTNGTAAAAVPLDEDDVAIYKKRIIDMLLPGENVFQALRRLGELCCG